MFSFGEFSIAHSSPLELKKITSPIRFSVNKFQVGFY